MTVCTTVCTCTVKSVCMCAVMPFMCIFKCTVMFIATFAFMCVIKCGDMCVCVCACANSCADANAQLYLYVCVQSHTMKARRLVLMHMRSQVPMRLHSHMRTPCIGMC